jgi:hypothetical protein
VSVPELLQLDRPAKSSNRPDKLQAAVLTQTTGISSYTTSTFICPLTS